MAGSGQASETQSEDRLPYSASRQRLPDYRRSVTHKLEIRGKTPIEGYVTVGLYDDGSPGEIFVKLAKSGEALRGLAANAWGIAMSFCLQYGVPLESLLVKYKFMRFEPSGMTANEDIPMAQSVVDYIARWLEGAFLPKGVADENIP